MVKMMDRQSFDGPPGQPSRRSRTYHTNSLSNDQHGGPSIMRWTTIWIVNAYPEITLQRNLVMVNVVERQSCYEPPGGPSGLIQKFLFGRNE